MRRITFILGLILLVSFSACQEEEVNLKLDTDQESSLVFGEYFGFCPLESDCATVFKIQDQQLFPDNIKRVGDKSSPITFQAQALPTAKYEVAKKLLDKVPAELLTSEQEVYGMPDAYDQGGLVVEFYYQGKQKRIYLDRDEKNLPASLVAFAKEIKSAISQIK